MKDNAENLEWRPGSAGEDDEEEEDEAVGGGRHDSLCAGVGMPESWCCRGRRGWRMSVEGLRSKTGVSAARETEGLRDEELERRRQICLALCTVLAKELEWECCDAGYCAGAPSMSVPILSPSRVDSCVMEKV